MDVLKAVIGTFIAFILLMAFSQPVYMVWDSMTEVSKGTSQSVYENMSVYNTQAYNIYTIVFGVIMIGGAIAIFLGITFKRRSNEYERYGGDYENYNY